MGDKPTYLKLVMIIYSFMALPQPRILVLLYELYIQDIYLNHGTSCEVLLIICV